jgi:hypothetical protein
VLRVSGAVLIRLPRIDVPTVLPTNLGTDPRPRVGKVGDDVWDPRA